MSVNPEEPTLLRLLLLEDNPTDADMITRGLERSGVAFRFTRVETEAAFRSALEENPDLILAEYNVPGFEGMRALEITRDVAPYVPFIFVSGSIGEDRAVQALLEGATDYVIKDRLSRLPSAITRALSERKQREYADETIRRLSHQNDLILKYAAEAIVGTDREGKVTFANPAAARVTGWPVEELKAAPNIETLIQRRAEGSIHTRCMREGKVISGEAPFWRKSGESFPARFSCSPILHRAKVIGCVFIFEDVTERKRLEQQLEQAKRVSSLGRVAATIAHEFNNVLMGIQPFAELIQRRSSDERTQKAAAQIAGSVARGKRVTDEILRFTQPLEPARATIDLDDWLNDLRPELRQLAGQDIDVVLEPAESPIIVNGDAAQLQQVLTNLVLNARDAMGGHGRIVIALDEHRECARLRVTDTGSGMTPEVLQQVFEPLFTTKRTGTGLGLAVAQQVIARHGGTIHVASEVGRGTTFTILLPRLPRPTSSRQDDRSAAKRIHRVLVVEDDPIVASGIVILLEAEGIEGRIVDRGGAAVQAIGEFHPDVVILDLSLQDIHGAEVYGEIAKAYPSLPVIFSSGQDDSALLRERAGGVPHVAFLLKPYGLEALVDALEAVSTPQ